MHHLCICIPLPRNQILIANIRPDGGRGGGGGVSVGWGNGSGWQWNTKHIAISPDMGGTQPCIECPHVR